MTGAAGTVNTVLGPVAAAELGVVAIHEALLSVLPGAQYGFDVILDRAEIFDVLAGKLAAFRAAGGGTVVDATGQFHGRDLRLFEALARTTGVHIVASTGQGPEALLGGYFMTPQTNPPTPWPAEKFAALFTQEITEGMVVPRLERRAPAGLVATAVTRAGMTPTDESLLRGSARTARATGVPVSVRFGRDALADLDILLDEGVDPGRVIIGGLDRVDAFSAGAPQAVARRGAYIALDHVGVEDDDYLTDKDRVALITELIDAGLTDRILLSSSSTGVAKGHHAHDAPLEHVLTSFVPALLAQGVEDADVRGILIANPAAALTVR